jgi:hypothetical protein
MARAAERDRGAFSRWGDSSEFRATLRRTALNVLRALLVFSSLLAALGAPARSSEYPQRPVHLVVGLAAGGGTDIVARVVADWLSHRLGQQFIVENRTGMGGNLAAQAVINAAPDGHTLLFTGPNNAIGTSQWAARSSARIPMETIFPACCALATSGHATAPPSVAMNSRRRMRIAM